MEPEEWDSGRQSNQTSRRRRSWCDLNDPCRYCKDYISGGSLRQACLLRPKGLKKKRKLKDEKKEEEGSSNPENSPKKTEEKQQKRHKSTKKKQKNSKNTIQNLEQEMLTFEIPTSQLELEKYKQLLFSEDDHSSLESIYSNFENEINYTQSYDGFSTQYEYSTLSYSQIDDPIYAE